MATGKLPLSDLVGLLDKGKASKYLYASEKRIPGNMAKLDTVTLRRTVNVLDDYRKSDDSTGVVFETGSNNGTNSAAHWIPCYIYGIK